MNVRRQSIIDGVLRTLATLSGSRLANNVRTASNWRVTAENAQYSSQRSTSWNNFLERAETEQTVAATHGITMTYTIGTGGHVAAVIHAKLTCDKLQFAGSQSFTLRTSKGTACRALAIER